MQKRLLSFRTLVLYIVLKYIVENVFIPFQTYPFSAGYMVQSSIFNFKKITCWACTCRRVGMFIFHMTYDKLGVHSIIVLFLFKQEYWGFKISKESILFSVFCFSIYFLKAWVLVEKVGFLIAYLVPGNGENAGFYTISPELLGALSGLQTPCRKAASSKWPSLRFAYTSFWASYAPVCKILNSVQNYDFCWKTQWRTSQLIFFLYTFSMINIYIYLMIEHIHLMFVEK